MVRFSASSKVNHSDTRSRVGGGSLAPQTQVELAQLARLLRGRGCTISRVGVFAVVGEADDAVYQTLLRDGVAEFYVMDEATWARHVAAAGV
jgi:hypothetical protein